jgi:DNA-directed RNA polymerase subunit RPC12/RpoP
VTWGREEAIRPRNVPGEAGAKKIPPEMKEKLMSSAVIKCPRCGAMLQVGGSHGVDHAAHLGVHHLGHSHPLLAAAVGIGWMVSKCFPKTHRCANCGQELSA